MLKKTVFGLALALVSGMAMASGGAGGIVVGGAINVWGGDVVGSAKSVSQGQAIAATQVAGNGSSFQHTDSITGGSATIGGVITPVGASVVTNTAQFATVNSYGSTTGDAPAKIGHGSNETIANGTMGFASSETKATGKANFAVGQIGGILAIGGAAGIVGW